MLVDKLLMNPTDLSNKVGEAVAQIENNRSGSSDAAPPSPDAVIVGLSHVYGQ
jgi:hypothetical protein